MQFGLKCHSARDEWTKCVLGRNHSLAAHKDDLIRISRSYEEAFEDAAAAANMTLGDVVQLLDEWDAYDKKSMMFRYAVKKDLTSSLPHDGFMLDVPRFAEQAEAVLEFSFEAQNGIRRIDCEETLKIEGVDICSPYQL